MINVLYISLCLPVSTSPHAGGQLAHYYVKKMNDDPRINLKLICYCSESEKRFQPQLEKDGFVSYCFTLSKRGVIKKIFNKFNKTTFGFIAGDMVVQVKNKCELLFAEGFVPDNIIFDWEDISFTVPVVKKIFPNSKYSVVEQDVKIQSIFRFYKSSSNLIKRLYYYFLYKSLIKAEKKYFPLFDDIVVLSNKDKNIIENSYKDIKKIHVISPFYYDYSDLKISEPRDNTIIFFGYLKRTENLEAVIWFIEEVLPLVNDISFVIIGGGVSDYLKSFESEKIKITGFLPIEEVKKYFEKALCMICPLLHGAGVKIKVLEGMSAGLPILTNNIGIEGINAIDNESYFHCTTPKEYVDIIEKLKKDKSLRVSIGNNARDYVHNNFDYKKSSYIEI